MRRAMRKAIGSLLLLVLLLVNTLPANGANSPDTSQKYEVYVLNSFSGERMGTVSDLVFSHRDIGFNYLGTAYSFSLEELDIDTSDGMNLVTGLSYVITYNWPSDGVSLWYDYMDSVSAYSSPAWPSSQLTNVSGNWIISIPDGAFVAEATVSALVQGAPLMWTLYDVSYMDGTHQ